MSEKKEENGNQHSLQSYINQNAISQTIVQTIHKSSGKRVLNAVPLNISADRAKKRVVLVSKGKRNDLPILGMSYVKDEGARMYQSVMADSKVELVIRKIKMSQLYQTNRIVRNSTSTKAKPQQHRQTFINHTIYPNYNRKHGYEHQKTRLDRNERKMRQLYTSYERYNTNQKLTNFKQNLRDEAIQGLRQSLRSGMTHEKYTLLI